MKNNFSSRVQNIIHFSREEALRLGHDYIGTEHLLLGVIREGEGIAVKILRNLNVDTNEVKQSVEDAVKSTGQTLTIGNIPFTKRAEKILKMAYVEAEKYKDDTIETEHLLLALIKEKDGVAAQVLLLFDITYEKAIKELEDILREPSNVPAKLETNPVQDDQAKNKLAAESLILVRMDRVTLDTKANRFAGILKDDKNNRWLPWVMGSSEAQAIALEMEGIIPPRPLTHDILKNLVEINGGQIFRAVINDLRENTYYSFITLQKDGYLLEVDARPSDAVALALRAKAPLFVVESVMNKAAVVEQVHTEANNIKTSE